MKQTFLVLVNCFVLASSYSTSADLTASRKLKQTTTEFNTTTDESSVQTSAVAIESFSSQLFAFATGSATDFATVPATVPVTAPVTTVKRPQVISTTESHSLGKTETKTWTQDKFWTRRRVSG
eukprot:g3742.t2